MKKIFLFLVIVGMTSLQSCEGPEGIPGRDGNDGYSVESEVFEIRNVNFVSDSQGFYGIVYDLNPQILNSDMILVYRRSGISNGSPIWESLPKTYYLNNGEELDYNFDFTSRDVSISIDYTDISVLIPQFTQNQLFRVVVIPGYLSNKNQSVNLNDYNTVVKVFNIDESKI